MDKLKMHSPDLTAEKIRQIAELLPNCVTESRGEDGAVCQAIDFDQLRQELSDHLVEGPAERYRLDWPGKREAILKANEEITETLRPCQEESLDFDTTKNIFIEGDNLDALKLLQETYLGKVKLIYIDPPYNTGNDFIYKDDFARSNESYLQQTIQKDEEGNRLVANPKTNGRFHSDWLTMLYSRLRLSRNLLADDGAIFISIDENEVQNLRELCDTVFGPNCFVGVITLLCNPKGRSQDKYFATNHEYIVVYSKTQLPKGYFSVEKNEEQIEAEYPLEDDGGKFRLLELRNTHREFGKHNRKDLYYPLFTNEEGEVFLADREGLTKVLPVWDDGFDGCWTWGKDKARDELDLLVGQKINGAFKIYRKSYSSGAERMLKTILINKLFYTERGQKEFNRLFNTKAKLFESPKSPYLIAQLLQTITSGNDLILDFFSGSGSTGHAVMLQNQADGSDRRYILVQLPSPVPEDSAAAKAGYATIAQLAKERLRRAGAEFRKNQLLTKPGKDTGFRVLKIDTSNVQDVYYTPDETQQGNLLDHVDNIKPDRTPDDLLFQVLLDWGVDLASPISSETVDGKQVFFVDGNALAGCFDFGLTDEFVKQIAERKPLRAVFRDASYSSDAAKINVEQIFKFYSPETELKCL